MKKAFLCFLMLSALQAGAQKRFSEGMVFYAVETSSGNPLVKDSSTYSLMVKGASIRSELKAVPGRTVSFFDAREGLGAVTREFGNQRILIPMDRLSWADLTADFKALLVEVTEGDTTILSYACQKVRAILPNGSVLVIWYTGDIQPEVSDINFPLAGLPGWPLCIRMEMNGEVVEFRAVSINFDPVPVQYFDLPRSGFRILSYEESKKIK